MLYYPYFTLSYFLSFFLSFYLTHAHTLLFLNWLHSPTLKSHSTQKKQQRKPIFSNHSLKLLVNPHPHSITSNTSLAAMEECYYKRNHVPAFGSWNWNDDLPFTQCFESARQAGLLRYSYSESEERDLYVTGDLYENDVVTPAVIVVPRRREKVHGQHEKEAKKQNWVTKEPLSPISVPRPTPKPVDEDLYKISPELLYAKTRKKKGLCFFPSCLLPTCIA